jgi:membrane fusion protein (multidrug efflux system)
MTTDLKHSEDEVKTSGETGRGEAPDSPTPSGPPRKRPKLLIPGVILVIVAIGLGLWWLNARNYEDTDDAQVDGHMNPISSRVAGTILAVHVEDNQRVKAGDPLVELDPKDFQVAAAQAEADFDQAKADVNGERPNLPITLTGNVTDETTGRAQVSDAEAALAAAQHDYDNAMAKL